MKVILNEGIKPSSSNGGRFQDIIIVNEKKEKFRIYILSESHESQSYARLYKWTNEKGWEVITSKNPKRDYKIDISHQSGYPQSAFNRIISDLTAIAEHF
jgi:hypothetical protein